MKRHVNILMVLRVMGWLLMIESLFMFMPLVTSLMYCEGDVRAFLIAICITLFSGLTLTFGLKPRVPDMGKREGFLLTALVWIVFPAFGMIPFLLCETPMSVSDAFFESMSGFTTTGASALPSVKGLSHGIMMWRCLIQWIGGMGIILFTLAVIPMLNHSGGMQMFNAEVTGITHEKIRPRVSETAKGLWGIYILLTVALTLLLWAGPMDFYESLCNSFSTLSTGGFSTSDSTIGDYGSLYLKIVLAIFMFFGGTNFTLMYKASRGNWKSLWENEVFRTYLKIIGIIYVVFVVMIVINGQVNDIESVTIDPIFQIVSTMTSTGLVACDYAEWGTLVAALMLVLMFFGACAGSTSGGAKIDRMLCLLKNTRNEIYRSLHPNAIMSVRINGRVVNSEVVNKVIAFLCLYAMIIIAGAVSLTSIGIPVTDAFSTTFSCISNTSMGVGGYDPAFALVPDAGKWILSAIMLVGRLEIFTVLVIFTRGFWSR